MPSKTATKRKQRIAPLVFNARSVANILAGKKTRTMRLIKPQPFDDPFSIELHSLTPLQSQWLAKAREIGLPKFPPEIHPYFTDMPESGLAFYWRARGCWNSKKLYRQEFYAGDIVWIRERHKITQVVPEPAPIGSKGSVPRIEVIYSDNSSRTIRGEFARDWIDHQKEHDRPTNNDQWRSPIFMPRAISRAAMKITNVKGHRIQSTTKAQAAAEGHTLESLRETWCELHGEDAWDRNDYVLAYSFQKIDEKPGELVIPKATR